MSFKVIIPSRYASSRLPGKPLLDIAGKPMVQHVYERAVESGADSVIIATDDARIRETAEAFGATVCMTSEHHRSGTERLAEAAEKLGYADNDIVVNVQGDEPMIIPELISQAAKTLANHQQADVATLSVPITNITDLLDPNVIKLVVDTNGYALYFSRAPIPWARDAFSNNTETMPEQGEFLGHVGIYAYRVGFLQEYVQLSPCALEEIEALEQLRVLWHGKKIIVGKASVIPDGHSVDTEEHLKEVRALMGGG